MATSQSILDALSDLNEAIVEAHATARTFDDLAGIDANAPSWPFVFSQNVRRIEAKSEALEVLIRQRALPLVDDMERATGR